MGTQEVINVLEKVRKPLTTKEIARIIGNNERTVRRILHNLRKDITFNLRMKVLSTKEKKKRYGRGLGSPYPRTYWVD